MGAVMIASTAGDRGGFPISSTTIRFDSVDPRQYAMNCVYVAVVVVADVEPEESFGEVIRPWAEAVPKRRRVRVWLW
jgi:hypothetical protein